MSLDEHVCPLVQISAYEIFGCSVPCQVAWSSYFWVTVFPLGRGTHWSSSVIVGKKAELFCMCFVISKMLKIEKNPFQ